MSIMSAWYDRYIFHYILQVKFSSSFNVFSAENFPSIRFKNIFRNGINRPLTTFFSVTYNSFPDIFITLIHQ